MDRKVKDWDDGVVLSERIKRVEANGKNQVGYDSIKT